MSLVNFNHRLHRLRARSASAFAVWLLIAGFLFQPVMTYLATPMLVVDGSANTVVICTLQGLKTIELEPSEAGDRSSQDLCPALLLLQHAHSAQISLPPNIYSTSSTTIAHTVQRPELDYSRPYFHAFFTRGPPAIS